MNIEVMMLVSGSGIVESESIRTKTRTKRHEVKSRS